ncbi:MAG: hypothetical protein ACYCW6_09945 [Candidatus Xenobia bacterium]
MSRRIGECLAALGLMVLGIAQAYAPTLGSGLRQMQENPGDTLLNGYLLEHTWQCVSNPHYIGSLWSPPYFWPASHVLALNENLLGSAFIYWLLRLAWPWDIAYQVWAMVAIALCFLCCWIALRKLGIGAWFSLLGAWLFAFGMPRLAQLGHQQLLAQFYTPLALLLHHHFVRRPSHGRMAALLLTVYLQILACIYLGWFLACSLVILTVLICLLDPLARTALRAYLSLRATLLLGLALVLGGATLAPYLTAAHANHRPFGEVEQLLPRWSSWFSAPPQSLLYGRMVVLHGVPPWEHHLFAGFVLLGMVGFSVTRMKGRPWCMAWLGTALCLVVITLDVRGLSLWSCIYPLVPGAASLRAVGRVSLLVYLYLSLACLPVLDTVRLRGLGPVLCVLAILEQSTTSLPSFSKAAFVDQARAVQSMMQGCDAAYLWPVRGDWPVTSELIAMFAGMQAQVPVVNGDAASPPPDYPGFLRPLPMPDLLSWIGPRRLRLLIVNAPPESLPRLLAYRESTREPFTGYWVEVPVAHTFRGVLGAPTWGARHLHLTLRNAGSSIWWSRGPFAVHLRARDGSRVVRQIDLPCNVAPHQTVSLSLDVIPSRRPVWQLELVQDGVAVAFSTTSLGTVR